MGQRGHGGAKESGGMEEQRWDKGTLVGQGDHGGTGESAGTEGPPCDRGCDIPGGMA